MGLVRCPRTRVRQSAAVLPALPCGCWRGARPQRPMQGARLVSAPNRDGAAVGEQPPRVCGAGGAGGARQRGGRPSKGPGTTGAAGAGVNVGQRSQEGSGKTTRWHRVRGHGLATG